MMTALRAARPLALLALASAVSMLSGAARAVAEGDTTTVYITGTLVDAPECTVNGNNTVDVFFGDDIITYQVNGENYKKQIVYTLSCSGVSQQGLKMTLNGTPAAFNSGLFKTSNTGLGIHITTGTDISVIPGSALPFTYGSPPVLHAVPVAKDPATLSTGYFDGSATMVLAYQ